MKKGAPKPKNMKKTLMSLLKYVGRYKVLLSLVIIFIVINSIAMVSSSYFLKPLVNNYILPGDFAGLAKMLLLLGSIFAIGACAAYGYSRIMVHNNKLIKHYDDDFVMIICKNTDQAIELYDTIEKMIDTKKNPTLFFMGKTSGTTSSWIIDEIEKKTGWPRTKCK